MKPIGIRELKNRLSAYVRKVRDGDTVLVTDRGVVVAELRPPAAVAPDGASAAMDALVRRGRATAGAPNRPDLYPPQRPLKTPRLSARLLDAERSER